MPRMRNCIQFLRIAFNLFLDSTSVPRFKLVQCPQSAAGKFSIRGGIKKVHRDGSPVYDIKNPYMATVSVNRELHTDASDRSCRYVEEYREQFTSGKRHLMLI